MTGFQPSLTSAPSGKKTADSGDAPGGNGARFEIEAAVRGLGVEAVYSVDPFDEEAMLAALKEAKSGRGVNVVVCHSPCVVHAKRVTKDKRAPFVIEQDRCNACSLCVRMLGCPGIVVEDEVYRIDAEFCDGCALCAELCAHDAIVQEGQEA